MPFSPVRTIVQALPKREAWGPMQNKTERARLVLEAIDRLDESDRELVQCGYYQGMTAPEIAEVLGVSEKTVDRRLQQLRGTLRGLMEHVIADARRERGGRGLGVGSGPP